MGSVLNVEDICEIGVHIERNGEAFYALAAENAADEAHPGLKEKVEFKSDSRTPAGN